MFTVFMSGRSLGIYRVMQVVVSSISRRERPESSKGMAAKEMVIEHSSHSYHGTRTKLVSARPFMVIRWGLLVKTDDPSLLEAE